MLQGNGFITDSNIISKYGLSDANPFFSTLWDKPYVGRVSCTLRGTGACTKAPWRAGREPPPIATP